jgi:hypothetical protein
MKEGENLMIIISQKVNILGEEVKSLDYLFNTE